MPDVAYPSKAFMRKPSTHWRPREPGEPPIDAIIVGGTLALGILLLIGAAAISIVLAVHRSDWKDTSLDDFATLGPTACQIMQVVDYRIVEKELNALNSQCIEQWRYRVQVNTDQEEHDGATFVTDWLSFVACSTTCDACSDARKYGTDFYVGVDILRRGEYIDDDTTTECWAPTMAVEQLSDYYNCGPQIQNSTCYQIQDPSDELKDSMDSYDVGMLGAYIGFGAGIAILLLFAYCVWKNRTVLAQDKQKMQEQEQE